MSIARFQISDLLAATQAVVLHEGKPFQEPVRIWTDTRTIASNDFFLPLSGEKFDGHRFLSDALSQEGIRGAFVQSNRWNEFQGQLSDSPVWILGVSDPLQAYLDIAHWYRRRLQTKIIAVTGSSGKTTTKEMLFAAFSPLMATQCTQKNFNNEIGVCQTLLSVHPDTRLLIVEMAMRGLGQIAPLSRCAEPDIAMIVNVGPAHIGLLGSLESIAIAKCEIFEGLNPDTGIGIINGDDELLVLTAPHFWQGRLMSYHLAEAQAITPTPEGGVEFLYEGERVCLGLPGRHMVANALGVLTAGKAMGLESSALISGLSGFQAGEGRWQKEPLPGHTNAWVINDAYNANPASVKASLEAFLEAPFPGLRRVLILGGMKELGEFAREYHEALGVWLSAQPDIDVLIALGEEGEWIARKAQNPHFPVIYIPEPSKIPPGTSSYRQNPGSPEHDSQDDSQDTAAAWGIPRVFQDLGFALDHTILYLKGSRAYHLENIPKSLANTRLVEFHGEYHGI